MVAAARGRAENGWTPRDDREELHVVNRPLRGHTRAQRGLSRNVRSRVWPTTPPCRASSAATFIRVALRVMALAVLATVALTPWGTAPASAAETCKPFIFIGARGSSQADGDGSTGMGDVSG